MRIFSLALFFLLFNVLSVSAQSTADEYIISSLVGSDTNPPTTPASLTATPVATTQINLAWSSSTDDYSLSGYQVFRDDVQIATTTTATYEDTGLSESTLYSYYVTAFDTALNISASSTPVATTTLTAPATTTPEDRNSPSHRMTPLPLEILSLTILPERTSATLTFETLGFFRSVVRWGRTPSYEMGSLQERSHRKNHVITITDLEPGERYYFTIEGENKAGRYGVLTESTFVTRDDTTDSPPLNVKNLRAVRNGDDVLLSWDNPDIADFSHVRVLSSDQYYPSDDADGYILYDDSGEGVVDSGAALSQETTYYTVFVYDRAGNISSGAIVKYPLFDVVPDTTNEIELKLEDIQFIQEGRRLQSASGSIAIDGAKQFTIRIPYETLPEHLKTITVTLREPLQYGGGSFSFLLRVDKEKKYYSATLAPLGRSGSYSFDVRVIDYKTSQIGYVTAELNSRVISFSENKQSFLANFLQAFVDYFSWFIIFLIALLLGAYKLIDKKYQLVRRIPM